MANNNNLELHALVNYLLSEKINALSAAISQPQYDRFGTYIFPPNSPQASETTANNFHESDPRRELYSSSLPRSFQPTIGPSNVYENIKYNPPPPNNQLPWNGARAPSYSVSYLGIYIYFCVEYF